MNHHSEIERIKEYYKWREENVHSWDNKDKLNAYICKQREDKLKKFFEDMQINLSEYKIFDVGCGDGNVLRNFVENGALPQNCFGVDLIDSRIEKAKEMSPQMTFECGNAAKLNHNDAFFDMILQFTCFSSILDNELKAKIAGEMLRVLKPQGYILWYDMSQKINKKNYRGISIQEMESMFINCDIKWYFITMHPLVAKMAMFLGHPILRIFENIKLWNINIFAVIKKL